MNAGDTFSAVGKSMGCARTASTRSRTSGSVLSAQATANDRSASEIRGTSIPSSSMQPATVRAIGPAWSNDGASGNTPSIGTSPYVGLKPATPQHAAGIRIEPPVSVPRPASATPSAIAAAVPPLEPPAVRPGYDGVGPAPEGGG